MVMEVGAPRLGALGQGDDNGRGHGHSPCPRRAYP